MFRDMTPHYQNLRKFLAEPVTYAKRRPIEVERLNRRIVAEIVFQVTPDGLHVHCLKGVAAKADPDLDPLREDPRFKTMLAAAEARIAAAGDDGW